jgi:2-methylcitrate dehydratase PrpD
MVEESLTEILSNFIIETRYENFKTEIIHITKFSLLDFVGSTIAGSKTKVGKILLKFIDDLGGNADSTVIGSGDKTSLTNAAFVNGGCCHILELDDIHKASTVHAAAPVIPPTLALTEKLNLSGKDLITAIIIGYEVAIRIGEAVNPTHYYYWHNTGTCGTFGAAAAAGKLLSLNKQELVNALGNAGSTAAGLWEFLRDGAMTKHLHPANAARNGLTAALLAKYGFTGPKYILEGKKGFFNAMAKDANANKITLNLGRDYKILENCFKLFPSCRHTHPTIDAILNLKNKYKISESEIKKIKIYAYGAALETTNNFNPKSSYEAKFSLPYCAAVAIIFGKPKLSHFDEQIICDERIRRLINKTEVKLSEDIDKLYPQKWPSKVIIEGVSNHFEEYVEYPKGDFENPASDELLIEKFQELVTPFLGENRTKNLIDTILDIDQLSNLKCLNKLLTE